MLITGQVGFYTAIDLLSGDDDQFGYQAVQGSYELTNDTEADASKTYYTRSGTDPNYTYTAVASTVTYEFYTDTYGVISEAWPTSTHPM